MVATACGIATDRESEHDIPIDGLPSGEVTWVADGDTVEVELESGITTVRLLGINAPDKGECFYEESTDRLVESLEGSTVTLDPGGLDQFGRSLAWVWHGSELVNLKMVDRGLAIATTIDQDGSTGTALLVAEQQAFEAGIGLWSQSACGAGGDPPEVDLDTGGNNPPGPDEDDLTGEYVTLTNVTALHIDLTGWLLRDESATHRYHFGDGTVLPPGDSLRISSADTTWEPGGQPVWNNGGDMALLLDENGRVVARSRYP